MGFSRNQHDVSAKFAYSHGSLAALLLFARKRRLNFLPCLTVFIKFACCSPRIKIPRGHRHQKKKQREWQLWPAARDGAVCSAFAVLLIGMVHSGWLNF